MTHLLRYIPFTVFLRRVVKRVFGSNKSNYWKEKDHRGTEFSNQFFPLPLEWVSQGMDQDLEQELDHYRNHRFDLLGSGMISWTKDQNEVLGFEGTSYPQRTIEDLPPTFDASNHKLDEVYGEKRTYDWQRDMRSGFRFPIIDSAFSWPSYASKDGVDVKVPWEFGRLQHLSRMAWYSNQPERDFQQFADTLIDFWRNNPPGIGVQWGCAMDVGIRVCNLIVAFSIWRARGQHDSNLDELIPSIIRWHGRYIFRHLESKEGLSNNHFLFNLTGLIFCVSFLGNDDSEMKEWLDYAHRNMEEQSMRQFFSDGGNFEGSIPYHFFSLEALMWSWMMLSRFGYKASLLVNKKLSKAIALCEDALLPNAQIPQIGDNDSGSLFKMHFSSLEGSEDLLNKSALMDLFRSTGGHESSFAEGVIFNQLGGLELSKEETQPIFIDKGKSESLAFNRKFRFELSKGDNYTNFAYPDFGWYGWRSEKDFIGLYLPPRNGHPSRGHRHADDGHLEIWINGKPIWRDPGSYCYTASPEWRNLFRSSNAHHTPFTGIDDVGNDGVFYLRNEVRSYLLILQADQIEFELNLHGKKYIRNVCLSQGELLINDRAEQAWNEHKFSYLSPSYGRKIEK